MLHAKAMAVVIAYKHRNAVKGYFNRGSGKKAVT
jgi:hypothetical protein